MFPQEDKRVHYPHLFAPPTLRTANLPSYRPARYLNPVLWTFATLGRKEKEQQMREYMWRTELPCNPTRTLTPDSVTDYEYDYDNRLVEVSLPTNNDTVEYTYDAMGRRLTKKFTYHNGANTDVTTYKYHYIGGQITEIEIDSIRNPGEGQSVLRNEEVKIHLGANSQPISYEWVKHVGESTTSATYYYHYDIHGNVLKVTDSSENVKITYTYDVLGKILTETNPDSILNFFTFRGASQTIWDSEVGMYYSGGYYRPDTGTALQGTGAPVLTNPATGSLLKAMAQVNNANMQHASHAMISAATAGSSSGGQPGGFSPPAGPSNGMSRAGRASPPTTETIEPTPTLTACDINGVNINSDYPLLQGLDNFECFCGGSDSCAKCQGKANNRSRDTKLTDEQKKEMAKKFLEDVINDIPRVWDSAVAEGLGLLKYEDLPEKLREQLIARLKESGLAKTDEEAIDILKRAEFIAWHYDRVAKKVWLFGIRYDGKSHYFYGPYAYDASKSPPGNGLHDLIIPGKEVKGHDTEWFLNTWGTSGLGGKKMDAKGYIADVVMHNFTGVDIVDVFYMWYDKVNDIKHGFSVYIPKGTTIGNYNNFLVQQTVRYAKARSMGFIFGDYELQEGDSITFYLYPLDLIGAIINIGGKQINLFTHFDKLSDEWRYLIKKP